MLVIAISTRALFDFTEENYVFEQEGLEAYKKFQRTNESIPLKKGVCYGLVEKLLNLNSNPKEQQIEVILCSRNSADSGLRVFNTIAHYGLPITRAIFSDGQPVHHYLCAYKVTLFLSAHAIDVKNALAHGIAAATILPSNHSLLLQKRNSNQLRFAFDADCVLFSDTTQKIHKEHGLAAFTLNEKNNAHKILDKGPFSDFIYAFCKVQKALPNQNLIRTALVTARSAPAHERVIRTLRQWDVTIDETFFLGKQSKTQLLAAYDPDIFFDDLYSNCTQSAQTVPTGHVPYGIMNSEQ